MDYPELITFFAAYKVAEIEGVPEYVAYCARYVDAVGFRVARDRTQMAKKAIEGKLDAQPTRTDQVRRALKLLASQRSLDFDRHYSLIVAGYKPAWSPTQHVYFEHAVKLSAPATTFFYPSLAADRKAWVIWRSTAATGTSFGQ